MDSTKPLVDGWNFIADKKVREWWCDEDTMMKLLSAARLFDFEVGIDFIGNHTGYPTGTDWHVKVTY